MVKYKYIVGGILGLGTLIFFFISGVYVENRWTEIHEKAKKTFLKALDDEFNKKSLKEELLLSSTTRDALKRSLPDTIYWEDKFGRRAYKLDKEKHFKNITEDTRLRMLHSIACEKFPIIPDTLYNSWKHCLRQSGIVGDFALLVSVSDKEENVALTSVPKVAKNHQLLFDYTIGYRCEIEIQGFFNPSMRSIFTAKGMVYLLCYWFFVIGVCKLSIIIYKRVTRSLLVETKEVTKVELVKGIVPTQVHIYQLQENAIFYAEQKKLVVNDKEYTLTPQVTMLLELFMETEGYIVTDELIAQRLWAQAVISSNRIQQAITRLRNSLDVIPTIHVERFENTGYQMFL